MEFGKHHSPAQLSIPLDIHTGNIARKLNLIKRKQNDAKTLKELDKKLREFDPFDPVKYDYALFGLGVFEKILIKIISAISLYINIDFIFL